MHVLAVFVVLASVWLMAKFVVYAIVVTVVILANVVLNMFS